MPVAGRYGPVDNALVKPIGQVHRLEFQGDQRRLPGRRTRLVKASELNGTSMLSRLAGSAPRTSPPSVGQVSPRRLQRGCLRGEVLLQAGASLPYDATFWAFLVRRFPRSVRTRKAFHGIIPSRPPRVTLYWRSRDAERGKIKVSGTFLLHPSHRHRLFSHNRHCTAARRFGKLEVEPLKQSRAESGESRAKPC